MKKNKNIKKEKQTNRSLKTQIKSMMSADTMLYKTTVVSF